MTLILDEVKEQESTNKIDWGRVDDGTYPARIAQVVDFGIQPQTAWDTGEPIESKPIVYVCWEFPTSRVEFDNDEGTTSLPRWQGKEYPVSKHEKSNLMKLVGTLKPNLRTIDELSNLPSMVQIGSTKGGNAKVAAVLQPMQGMDVAELENDAVFFDFDHPTQETFEALKFWQQKKIRAAENYTGFADAWGEEQVAPEGEY